ncbi:hypothetical protein MRX96_010653 [Rhipicephalus microplus]
MRYSGPSKRRRQVVPGRVPPMWTGRPTPGGPLWPPSSSGTAAHSTATYPKVPRDPTSRHMIPGEPPIPLTPFTRPPIRVAPTDVTLSKPSKEAAASLPPEGPCAAVDPETTATKQVRRRSREHQAVRCGGCRHGHQWWRIGTVPAS